MTLQEQQHTLDAAILATEDAVTRLHELRARLEHFASPARMYARVNDGLVCAQRHVATLLIHEAARLG